MIKWHNLRNKIAILKTETKLYTKSFVGDPFHSHRVIFTTSLYKSHDARTMTLQKSEGVGTLTMQLSCKNVNGFKRPSMFIFGCTFEPCFKVM